MIIDEATLNTQYHLEEKTISLVKANIYAGIIFVALGIPCFALWFLFNPQTAFYPNWGTLGFSIFMLLISFSIIVLIIVHELIHGLFWMPFCENKWKSIKFGILKEMLTPYCNCKEVLTKKQYLVGAIMPFILTGIIPLIISIVFGWSLLLVISIIGIGGACGDLMICMKLIREKSNVLLKDHPTKVGYIVYSKNN